MQIMNVYFSHITALRLWRRWSLARPLALRAFHDLGKRTPSDLFPASHYRTTSSLNSCASSARDVRAVLASHGTDELREALENCHDEGSARPWHILVREGSGTRNSALLTRHRSSIAFPAPVFAEIAPHIFLCLPELVFVQMAAILPFGKLLALGYELCGCYPRSRQLDDPFVRRPLTTPARLIAFAAQMRNAKGAKLARTVARHVCAKSGSTMETELAAIAFAPELRGGLGIARAFLNEPVSLSQRASRVARCKRVVCDMYWPKPRFGIEYDGRTSHASPQRQDHDSRKRDGMLLDGVDLVTLTSSQFHHVEECRALLDSASRRAGKPRRRRAPDHLERHMELRRQLRAFHRAHFPDIPS